MDGFVSSHIAANGAADGPYTMSYLDRTDHGPRSPRASLGLLGLIGSRSLGTKVP
jgi:hypothetical protein